MSFGTFNLEAFIASAETGSFTKAGQRVGRTQSAISQQIAKLEKILGKELFLRDKKLLLTHEGEIFLGYAKQIYQLHREAFDRFKEPDLVGEVHFGLPEDFASVYLTDVLTEFSQTHPRIQLNIECDLTINLFERFKKKEFDLVLVKMNRPEDFPNGHEIWTEDLVWVGSSIQLSKDSPIPLVLSPLPCVYRAKGINCLDKAKKKWHIVFSSTSYAGTVAAVKAGMGITVLPRTMIPKELDAINHEQLPPLKEIHVSLLKHRADNSAVNSFENFMIKKLI